MEQLTTAEQKALHINLNERLFGTFAEIGAGQEVARHFFRVGAGAGTIAKSMSAYDMTFSDAIYGRSGRYVSQERLERMLEHEYSLLIQRLSRKRGAKTTFFAFANTVAAASYKGSSECHGWMGMRFQHEPLSEPNNVVLHVRMCDHDAVSQQQALGIIGTSIVYACFYYRDDPDMFVTSLIDELSTERIEVDMIEFTGPAFEQIDNRVMALRLVQQGLTDATMFAPDGKVLQPSEVLYKKPVLIERGSFRPITHVNLDMLDKSLDELLKVPGMREKDPVVLVELTLSNLLTQSGVDRDDYLARADSLSALGYTVMISDFSEHYRLPLFFRRYTQEPVAMVGGINALFQVLGEEYYRELPGGIMEALGRLFKLGVTFYVYPMSRKGYLHYMKNRPGKQETLVIENLPDVISARDVIMSGPVGHLHHYLLEKKVIVPLEDVDHAHLEIFSKEVLRKIRAGDESWEEFVPAPAAAIIKSRGMFRSAECKSQLEDEEQLNA